MSGTRQSRQALPTLVRPTVATDKVEEEVVEVEVAAATNPTVARTEATAKAVEEVVEVATTAIVAADTKRV